MASSLAVVDTLPASSVRSQFLEAVPHCPSPTVGNGAPFLSQTKEETIRKYRQWLGALLECTTKLSAGRAAAAAAEAEVKQREGDLALLNEEVASFMSKARWVMTKR